MMITMLTKLGDDLALILDREALEAHGIDGQTRLEVIVDAQGIHIRPASEDHASRVLAAAQRVMEAHDETFRKLAL